MITFNPMKQERILRTGLAVLFLLNIGTIGILLLVKSKAEKRLTNASGYLRELGEQYIEYLVEVQDTLDVETEISIIEPVPVDIDMLIRDKIPVRMNVEVNEKLSVPVAMNISEVVHVDTSITMKEKADVYAKSVIPVNQKFTWLWSKTKGPKMKIKAEIPLDQNMQIAFNDKLRFESDIPVRFTLRDNLPVGLDLDIPVDQKIDLALKVKQRAVVGFPFTMKMRGKIPITMKIPVKIPLRETPIKTYLDKTADELDDMLSF
jgi:hypothetical protein